MKNGLLSLVGMICVCGLSVRAADPELEAPQCRGETRGSAFVQNDDTLRAKAHDAGFKGRRAAIPHAPVGRERLEQVCATALSLAMKTWNPETGVVTGRDWTKCHPPTDAKDNLYPMYPGRPDGFGPGGGDDPLICGTILSGLVDQWKVTHDPAVKATAAKVARGVLNLAILHGYKGFVCRGFCSDNKTAVDISSRDQYTHWVHGLWRYASSDMADPEIVAGYKREIVNAARFMEERIVPEREWNFGYPQRPGKDCRGICTMWGPEIWPHEAARLPMIYAAAAMEDLAGLAKERMDEAIACSGKTFYGMCWDGELLLAQMMWPGFGSDDAFLAFLEETITRCPPESMDVCRIAHVFAAYWRYAGHL